jgi:hypothetical protein
MFSNTKRGLLATIIFLPLASRFLPDPGSFSTAFFPLLHLSSPPSILSYHSAGLSSGLTPLPDGSLLLCDTLNDRVVRLAPNGQPLLQIGKMGQGPGEFNFPFALDRLSNGSIAVLDHENSRIEMLSQSGGYLREIPVGAPGLKGLATFPDGPLYISRNGLVPGTASDYFFSVVGLNSRGQRDVMFETPEPVLDLKREVKGNLWALFYTGPVLYRTDGKLLRRLTVPDTESLKRAEVKSTSVNAVCLAQGEDGRVVVGTGDGTLLMYDEKYQPLGIVPAKELTGTRLTGVALVGERQLWAADDSGKIVRVTLPN